MMSMSIMGLAARPGTEVLPTCSMLVTGMSERMVRREDLMARKEAVQVGSEGMMLMRISAVSEACSQGRDRWNTSDEDRLRQFQNPRRYLESYTSPSQLPSYRCKATAPLRLACSSRACGIRMFANAARAMRSAASVDFWMPNGKRC